jgi:hypothetical protein
MKNLVLFFFLSFISISAQNASDYFPSVPGMKWFFRTVPFDSLGQPVDSLSSYQIDSFAVSTVYENKLSSVLLSKYGTLETILDSPWLDTSYVHTSGSNIWNYVNGLDELLGGFSFDIEGWYSVYRLSASTLLPYTIFSHDTLITIDSINYTLVFEVTGRRTNDQVITTPYGQLSCKKIIIRPAVKIIPQIFPIPITLFSVPDTVYLAPGYYKVRSVRPNANIDLSLFGYPSFVIPGSRTDAITPPAVLSIDSLFYNVSARGDTIHVIVNNDGEDILNWNSKIVEGSGWITLKNSAGTGGDTLLFYISKNDTTLNRYGIIEVSDPYAFNSPQYLFITQAGSEIVVSYNEIQDIPVDYSLSQNYPNPFNPLTNIGFTLRQSGNIKLLLYDILGNTAAVIAEGYFSAGSHNIRFNAEGLSSGIYIYRITADNYSGSRKMIILK